MQKKVKKVRNSPSISKFKKLVVPRPDVLHSYLKHNEINQYLEYVEHRHSEFVKVHTLGRSYEGRPLRAIEIDWSCPKHMVAMATKAHSAALARLKVPAIDAESDKAQEIKVTVPAPCRNIVFIEGGTHAREWMTICVALNCIYQLTEKNMRHQDLLRKLRFFIVPVVNPDGYEYTRTKNRRWRKNRRPQKNSKNIGTDCNRNYDFHWDQGTSKASRNTYKGDKPFSEPETCALRNALQKLAPHLLFVLSLHSYAQSIMYPWGYCKDLPESWQQLQKLAIAGRNAIKTYTGRHYRTGSIASLAKHTIPGSIVDYAFGCLGVPLALVMELPSKEFGFQPPAEAISTVGHESWFGIREMCKCAYDLTPPVFPQEEAVWVAVCNGKGQRNKKKVDVTLSKRHKTKAHDSSSDTEELCEMARISLTRAPPTASATAPNAAV